MTEPPSTTGDPVRAGRAAAGPGSIVILAAGQGTRMRSRHAKVVAPLGGRPLLAYVLDAAAGLAPEHLLVVVGHQREAVEAVAAAYDARCVHQAEQKGTGHAVQCALAAAPDLDGALLILCGDVPLITADDLARLRAVHQERGAVLTVVTAEVADPTGYGRIVRDGEGTLTAIVEEKDATADQRRVREINTGLYAVEVDRLREGVAALTAANAQEELYLTDMVTHFRERGLPLATLRVEVPETFLGVNDRAQLAAAYARLRARKAQALMAAGVTLLDPASTYVDPGVEIGPDTIIHPQVLLLGRTRIGRDCVVESFSRLKDAEVADGVQIKGFSHIEDTRIGPGAAVGPFCRFRMQSEIGPGAKVGNFVETKKTRVGPEAKASHLTYLGDAEVGEGANIGAGTITCNYDGTRKHRTEIKAGAFIGSNSSLVAPVTVGEGAYVGAGSTITEDVPDQALALGRGRQVNKAGWARQAPARTKKRANKS